MLVLYYGGFSGISLNWKQCVGPAFIQSPPFLPSAASRIYKVQRTNLAGLVLHYFSPSGESSDSYIFESKKKKSKFEIPKITRFYEVRTKYRSFTHKNVFTSPD